MDEPSGHGPLGGPDYVTALKSVKASWSEAIALLAGPSATSVGVSAEWAKAAEVTGRKFPRDGKGAFRQGRGVRMLTSLKLTACP